jgi:hypothetical protein
MKKTTQEKKRMKRKAKKKAANRQITTIRERGKSFKLDVDMSTAYKRLKASVGGDIDAFEATLPVGWRDLPYLDLSMPNLDNGITEEYIKEWNETHTIWLAHSKSYRNIQSKPISDEVLKRIKEIQLEDNLDPETDNGLWWANYF